MPNETMLVKTDKGEYVKVKLVDLGDGTYAIAVVTIAQP